MTAKSDDEIAFKQLYNFKMNMDEYKFSIQRDGLEYFKINDRENKIFKEYSMFHDYITQTSNREKFKGMIRLRFVDKGELELITQNEAEYKEFISRISGYLNSIDNKK
jgi:hypothetical protein